jgi:hypothetical protein
MWRYKRLSPSGRVALVELALSGFQAIGRESVAISWRSDLDVSPSSLKARARTACGGSLWFQEIGRDFAEMRAAFLKTDRRRQVIENNGGNHRRSSLRPVALITGGGDAEPG